MCAYSISTTIFRKVYAPEKSKTSTCIKSMKVISYIIYNGIFYVTVGYKCGLINNSAVITKIKLATKIIIIYRQQQSLHSG